MVLLGDSDSRGLGAAFCSVGYVLHDLGTGYFPFLCFSFLMCSKDLFNYEFLLGKA